MEKGNGLTDFADGPVQGPDRLSEEIRKAFMDRIPSSRRKVVFYQYCAGRDQVMDIDFANLCDLPECATCRRLENMLKEALDNYKYKAE